MDTEREDEIVGPGFRPRTADEVLEDLTGKSDAQGETERVDEAEVDPELQGLATEAQRLRTELAGVRDVNKLWDELVVPHLEELGQSVVQSTKLTENMRQMLAEFREAVNAFVRHQTFDEVESFGHGLTSITIDPHSLQSLAGARQRTLDAGREIAAGIRRETPMKPVIDSGRKILGHDDELRTRIHRLYRDTEFTPTMAVPEGATEQALRDEVEDLQGALSREPNFDHWRQRLSVLNELSHLTAAAGTGDRRLEEAGAGFDGLVSELENIGQYFFMSGSGDPRSISEMRYEVSARGESTIVKETEAGINQAQRVLAQLKAELDRNAART